MVFPNPISSARMVLVFCDQENLNQLSPSSWYACRLPPQEETKEGCSKYVSLGWSKQSWCNQLQYYTQSMRDPDLCMNVKGICSIHKWGQRGTRTCTNWRVGTIVRQANSIHCTVTLDVCVCLHQSTLCHLCDHSSASSEWSVLYIVQGHTDCTLHMTILGTQF